MTKEQLSRTEVFSSYWNSISSQPPIINLDKSSAFLLGITIDIEKNRFMIVEGCTQYQYWRINNFVWRDWKRRSRRGCGSSCSRQCGCCRCRDRAAIVIWTRTTTRTSRLAGTILDIFIIFSMTVRHTECIMIAIVKAAEIFYFQFILTFQKIAVWFKIITSTKCAALKRNSRIVPLIRWNMRIPRLHIRSDSFPYKGSC